MKHNLHVTKDNLHIAEAAQADLADLYAEGLQLEEILQYERQQLQEMELQAEIDEMERLVALERHELYEATIKSLEEASLAKEKEVAKRKYKPLRIASAPKERKPKEPRVAHKPTETGAMERWRLLAEMVLQRSAESITTCLAIHAY